MNRHWRVYKAFITTSFQRELEFRANFWAKVGQNIICGAVVSIRADVFADDHHGVNLDSLGNERARKQMPGLITLN